MTAKPAEISGMTDVRERVRALVPAGLVDPSPRARSLILTVWGDTVMPHGGRAWLGSLIRMMAPLGLDERLVRTSVQRLTNDGWLQAEAFGRRRQLLMPPAQTTETQAVQTRMYTTARRDWDGTWHMIITRPETPARREALRRELVWAGYAGLSPNQFIHPRNGWPVLADRLAAKDLDRDIAHRITARFDDGFDDAAPPPPDLWPVTSLQDGWQALARDFATLQDRITANPPDPETTFTLRTLVVHAHRRMVLRDPDLPGELLPATWPAATARARFRDLWQALQPLADPFTRDHLSRCDGKPLPTGELYGDRF